MENPKIFIKGIKGGEILDLSDNGETEVDSDGDERTITWEIINCDQVRLFYIESKKGHNPFNSPIPKTYASSVELEVREKHPKHVWEYAIVWLDRNGIKHRHDPKIAIKSSRVGFTHPHDNEKGSWKPWVALALGLLGLALWLSDNKKKGK